MTTFPHGETITVLHPAAPGGGRTGYNRPVEAAPTEQVVEGVGVAPGASDEVLVGQDTSSAAYTLFITDTAVVVEPTAQVVVRGDTYEVIGRPEVWRSPFTGWEPGTVVAVGAAS